jgi:hypothetical protein
MIRNNDVPQVTKFMPFTKLRVYIGTPETHKFVYSLCQKTYNHMIHNKSLGCNNDQCYKIKKQLFEESLQLISDNISGQSPLDTGRKMLTIYKFLIANLIRFQNRQTQLEACLHSVKANVDDPDIWLLYNVFSFFLGGFEYRNPNCWGYQDYSCWQMAMYYCIDSDTKKVLKPQSEIRVRELLDMVQNIKNLREIENS